MTAKRAVIYLRVSTKDQAARGGEAEGFSIPAQREACRRKAEALDAVVVDEFVDAGESARSTDRPDLQRMLTVLSREPVNFVIVHKVDRLARNRADDVEINLAIQKSGATLVSVTENIDETPSGILLHGIMSSIAEFYSRNLANEVVKGMTQKAQSGGTVGKAPIGYRNVRRVDDLGREQRYVEVDDDRADLISWAFRRYAEGDVSLNMLVEEATDRGLTTRPTPKQPAKPLTVSGMHKVLVNPYYLGEVVYRGVRYGGKHPAIIDVATWQTVQDVLSSHRSAGDRQEVRDHYLKGSVFCGGCGSRLLVSHASNRWGAIYPYLICAGRHRRRTTCTRKAVLIETVEQKIIDEYRWISLTSEQAEHLRQVIEAELRTISAESAQQARRTRTELTRLREAQAKLMEAHYAGAVPVDLLRREQSRLSSEIARAETTLAAAERDWDQVMVNLAACLTYLTDCAAAYANARPSQRRMFNQAFFERIEVHEDESVSLRLMEPIGALLDADALQATATAESGAIPRSVPANRGNEKPRPYSFGQGLNKTTLVELLRRYSNTPVSPKIPQIIPRSKSVAPQRPHQARRRLGPEAVAQLVADYRGGQPTTALMATYSLGKGTVLKLLADKGIPLRNQGAKHIDLAEAAERYAAGWSLRRLGEHYGCDAETVRKALKDAGVPIRPRRGWS